MRQTRDYVLSAEEKRAVQKLLDASGSAGSLIRLDDTPYANSLHLEADDHVLSHSGMVLRSLVEALVSREATCNLSRSSIGRLDNNNRAAVLAMLSCWLGKKEE